MSGADFFKHAVDGFRRRYPRAKNEMGVGSGASALAAILFKEVPIIFWLGTSAAIAIAGFYPWALIVAIRLDAREGDLDYDRRGKYKLSKEYWDTESATSAKAKKVKSGRS